MQEDLDEETGQEELTKEEWEEVEKRYGDIDNNASQFMSGDEFTEKMNTLQNELRSKRS